MLFADMMLLITQYQSSFQLAWQRCGTPLLVWIPRRLLGDSATWRTFSSLSFNPLHPLRPLRVMLSFQSSYFARPFFHLVLKSRRLIQIIPARFCLSVCKSSLGMPSRLFASQSFSLGKQMLDLHELKWTKMDYTGLKR